VPGSIKNIGVGFMHPNANAPPNPSYRDVCSGRTGYVEVYDCELTEGFDNAETYEKLLKHFFTFHDPTTLDKQGNDRGSQYGSVIFYAGKSKSKSNLKLLV